MNWGAATVAMSMPSMSELSGYVLEPLREGPDFTLYRGRQPGNPSPQILPRLEHEYSLAAELTAWAVKHLTLTRAYFERR